MSHDRARLAMSEVTMRLPDAEAEESSDAGQLVPLVYNELRRSAKQTMSAQSSDQMRQPTALIHEVYAKLGSGRCPRPWNRHGQFYFAAAESMRRLLIEIARRKDTIIPGARRCYFPPQKDIRSY